MPKRQDSWLNATLGGKRLCCSISLPHEITGQRPGHSEIGGGGEADGETKMTLTEDAPSTTQYNQITATNVESGCDIRRLNQNWTPKQRYSELNITFGNRYKNWEAVRVRCAAVQRMTLRQNSSITGADNPENKTVEPGNSEQVAKNFTIFCKIGLQYWNLKFEKVCLKFWMFFSKKGTIVL